ncbi:Abi-like protein [Dyadobacter koreensis]|uniref:Abi-like protein n=1 Tax=Dyadobacter koreensis TaxID=408657 RepID=A0A1H6QZ96_9BACT|nr:HEPN domain-containing protein [Dyadobacter koreensis]SEI46314.1 Abi-like protein [Dyadobacter koreensis]
MEVFEILCVDYNDEYKLKTAFDFTSYLISIDEIWESPKLNKNKIEDMNNSSVSIEQIDNQTNNSNTSIFQLSFSGESKYLEKARLIVLENLSKLGIKKDNSYVLKDTISKQIASQLYPLINEVESSLRKYLIKFFVSKIGTSWWNLTVNSRTATKADSRTDNEKAFVKFIDNKIYLIDFGDLGKMVYSDFTTLYDKTNLIAQILKLEETVEALIDLKKGLESNYTKFFKDTFKAKGFENKWKTLEEIRNKVAHNNLFTNSDLKSGMALHSQLMDIIYAATAKIETIQLNENEVEAFKDDISKKSNGCKIHVISFAVDGYTFNVSDNGGRIILNGGFYKTKEECYDNLRSLSLIMADKSNFHKYQSGMTTSFVIKDKCGNVLANSTKLLSGLDLDRDIDFLQNNYNRAEIIEISSPPN